jgi:NlpC/P60 family putative phage cell wall peptidase
MANGEWRIDDSLLATHYSPARSAIVAEARSWIGTPYHHQASVKGVGCDCLGLVRGVWRAVYGAEPEPVPGYTKDWGEMSGEETMIAAARRHLTEMSVGEALPGDVLVFRIRRGRMAKHAGLLSAPGRFIHAQEGGPASEVPFSDWWRERVAAVFRFPAQVS